MYMHGRQNCAPLTINRCRLFLQVMFLSDITSLHYLLAFPPPEKYTWLAVITMAHRMAKRTRGTEKGRMCTDGVSPHKPHNVSSQHHRRHKHSKQPTTTVTMMRHKSLSQYDAQPRQRQERKKVDERTKAFPIQSRFQK